MAENPQSDSRYESQGEIARGGMGVIYKVHDCDLDRTLAMKRMMSAPDLDGSEVESADCFARFMEEAHVTAQLDHPGIVPVFDLGTDDDGCAWYTMKLVRGRELGDMIRLAQEEREHWNLPRLVGVLMRICQAMAHAHGKGVIHRDLKPANIMVGDLGEVYVMDWGLAKQLGREDVHDVRLKLGDEMARSGMETITSPRATDSDSTSSIDAPLMTMDGAVIGTPAYMPPEQAAGIVDQIDHLSDIYALGAILYEVLAESPPYRDTGATVARDVITALSNGPPTPVRAIRSDAPVELAAICEKAMSRIREDRYPTSLELAEDLQAYLDGRVVKAHQTGAVAEFKKWVLRNKGTSIAFGLVALSLVALAVFQTVAKRDLAASFEKEEKARKEAQEVLADSFVTFGLLEGEKREFARAKLWFNEATNLSASDPDRLRANRLRVKTFGDLAPSPMRTMKMPLETWSIDEIHPTGPFAILHGQNAGFQVVDIDRLTLLEPSGGGREFYAAGFDPSSSRVAGSPVPGKVNIRNLPDGEILDAIDLGEEVGEIRNLTWSEDGSLLYLGSEPGRILDLKTKSLWPVLLHQQGKGEADVVRRARFSPSGNFIVTVLGNSRIELFQLDPGSESATQIEILRPAGHGGWLAPLFLGEEEEFILATQRGTISLIKCISGKQVAHFAEGNDPPDDLPEPILRRFQSEPVLGFHLHRNVVAFPDRAIRASKYPPKVISADGHEHPLPKFLGEIHGFLNFGAEPLAIVRKQQFLNIWRMPQDRRRWSIPCGRAAHPIFSPDGRYVAKVGEEESAFQVIEIAGRNPVGEKIVPGGIIRCADLASEGEKIAVFGIHPKEGDAGASHRVEFWDWEKGERLGDPAAMPSAPLAVRYHSGGAWIAVACSGGQVIRIDAETRETAELFKAGHALDQLVFAEIGSGEVLIAAHEQLNGPHRTFIWDISGGAFKFPPMKHVGHGYEKPISVRDGILITPNGPHTFCDLETGEALGSKIAEAVGDAHLSFGNDARTVFVSARTTGAKVLDWRTGEPVCPDLVHGFRDPRWVHRTLAVPGTPWIVVCGSDGVRFFDRVSGKPVAPPIDWPRSPELWLFPHCQISPDGKTLAYHGHDQAMHLVDLSFLREEPGAPATDQEFDELAAGARVVGGGLVEMNYQTEWFRLLRKKGEANLCSFRVDGKQAPEGEGPADAPEPQRPQPESMAPILSESLVGVYRLKEPLFGSSTVELQAGADGSLFDFGIRKDGKFGKMGTYKLDLANRRLFAPDRPTNAGYFIPVKTGADGKVSGIVYGSDLLPKVE